MGPMLVRLAVALFALQAGFHGFTASLPVALARAGVADEEIGVIVGLAAPSRFPRRSPAERWSTASVDSGCWPSARLPTSSGPA